MRDPAKTRQCQQPTQWLEPPHESAQRDPRIAATESTAVGKDQPHFFEGLPCLQAELLANRMVLLWHEREPAWFKQRSKPIDAGGAERTVAVVANGATLGSQNSVVSYFSNH